ncbi:hypothetical protein, partial [Mesorhizobium sp.]|uniref:hypothetical protein n=1 Tax=Mesorhizobium sp. TaxID=1871066 RepID=UPI0025E90B8A
PTVRSTVTEMPFALIVSVSMAHLLILPAPANPLDAGCASRVAGISRQAALASAQQPGLLPLVFPHR